MVIGNVINIEKKEVFTRTINSLLQGGKNKLLKISYKFTINNKEYNVYNDKILISPKSKLDKLVNNDLLNIYVYVFDGNVKET